MSERESFDAWHKKLEEEGHGAGSLQLRETIVELKRQHPDVNALAKKMWGGYDEFNDYYLDKVDENGNLTPEGIEAVYEAAARKKMYEDQRDFKNAVGSPETSKGKKPPKLKKEKEGPHVSITDIISKHGLRAVASITALKDGKYEVLFFRRDGGNNRPNVVSKFRGTSSEIDEHLTRPEIIKELHELLGK